MLIWIIGLSGSGKTHLGRMLVEKIREARKNTIFIDGDEFRTLMMNDLGYTDAERKINGCRILNICHWLVKQNINVVASFLSNYPEQQHHNKNHLGDSYYQVFVKSDIEILKKKSIQNVYKREKNIIGVDIPFNEPTESNITYYNDYQEYSAQNLIDTIYNNIKNKLV